MPVLLLRCHMLLITFWCPLLAFVSLLQLHERPGMGAQPAAGALAAAAEQLPRTARSATRSSG